MSLSPWPTLSDPATAREKSDLHIATSALKDAISPGSANEYIQRLGATASAIIEKYAEDAPVTVRDNALIMLCGYLHETGKEGDYGTARDTSIEVDTVTIKKTFNPAPGALRRSGAMSLLSPWRDRAGVTA